ncbi:MAG: calcium-binding protein [Solirubrobacterales bacterium]
MYAAACALTTAFAGQAWASDPITCSFSPTDGLMQVQVEHWGMYNAFGASRHDQSFRALEWSRNGRRVFDCAGGRPTVRNVDRIEIRQAEPPPEYSTATFLLDMSQGPFAPGATPEPSGKSEIEVAFHLVNDELNLIAPPGPNRVSFGLAGEPLAIDLNGDGDLDVSLGRAFLTDFQAGKGADQVDARTPVTSPRPRHPLLFISGGDGPDILIAGRARDQLYGGKGADRVVGSDGGSGNLLAGGGGTDTIAAGHARNLIMAGRGDDRIDARNGVRDWISCGPGNDRIVLDRHEEHVDRCEHLRYR